MSFNQLQSFRRPPTSKMSSSDIDSGRRDLSSFRSKGNVFKKNQFDRKPQNEESDKENNHETKSSLKKLAMNSARNMNIKESFSKKHRFNQQSDCDEQSDRVKYQPIPR